MCLDVTHTDVIVAGAAGIQFQNPNDFEVQVGPTTPVEGLPLTLPANSSLVYFPTESFCYITVCPTVSPVDSVVINCPTAVLTDCDLLVDLTHNNPTSITVDYDILINGAAVSGASFSAPTTSNTIDICTALGITSGSGTADVSIRYFYDGDTTQVFQSENTCTVQYDIPLNKQAELAANPNRCGFGENAAGGTNLVEVSTPAEFFAAIQVDDNHVCLTEAMAGLNIPINSPISNFADRITIDGSRAPGVNFDGSGLANNQWIFRFFGDDIVLHNFSGNGSGSNNGSNISFINLYGKRVWVDKITATAFNDDFINILLDADEITVSRVKATNTSKSVFVFNPSFPSTRVTVHSSELAAISRNPYLSAGQLHSFNNWIHNNSDSGTRAGRTAVQSGLGGFTHTGTAEIISQENVFNNIQFQALVTTTDNAAAGGNEGFIESINDNLNGEPVSGNVTFVSAPSLFTPPDCDFIKPNSEVIAYVQANAGADQ